MLTKTVINGEESNQSSDIIKTIDDKIIIIYVNSFTEESAKNFYNEFNKASKSKQQIIPILIDSYGGAVDALVSMMDIVESSTIPVATICLGKAMSAGAFLLSCGKEGMRYIAPSARVMIHHITSFSWDKFPEMKVKVEETERLQELIFRKMARNCGKNSGYFLDELKVRGNTDWYLSPEECLKHNIVNHIKIPQLKTEISIKNVLV